MVKSESSKDWKAGKINCQRQKMSLQTENWSGEWSENILMEILRQKRKCYTTFIVKWSIYSLKKIQF